MTLAAFEIPDEPAQLAAWLERHLVSLDLGVLVAELAAVHPEPSSGHVTLRDFLGPQRLQTVLGEGLCVLQPSELRRLLTRPRLLLELQELVLFAGGSHWKQLSEADHGITPSVLRGEKRLQTFLNGWRQRAGSDRGRLLALQPAWYQRPLVVGLATAAAVLLGVFLWDRYVRPAPETVVAPGVPAVAWGWSRPDAFPQDMSAGEYLNHLADGANAWFAKKPEDTMTLAVRITEFRLGCTTLQLADHKPLAAVDQKWLLDKCRLWAARLDKHLADVETGKDVVLVRTETDETVTKLVTALREQAKKE